MKPYEGSPQRKTTLQVKRSLGRFEFIISVNLVGCEFPGPFYIKAGRAADQDTQYHSHQNSSEIDISPGHPCNLFVRNHKKSDKQKVGSLPPHEGTEPV